MIIAIDGPAASGKGTVAARLAHHLGVPHLDTGLLYRAVGLQMADRLDDEQFESQSIAIAESLNTDDLDPDILSAPEIAIAASKVSRIEGVRAALRQFQRDFAGQEGGAVLDGRDIGTRICPNADVKFYITATPEVRAKRRTDQLRAKGTPVNYDEMLAQIEARDAADRENPAGAFYLADGAHLLDTSEMDIEAAFRAALAITEAALDGKSGA